MKRQNEHFSGRKFLYLLLGMKSVVSGFSFGTDITWVGGDGTWNDGRPLLLWSPADEPDPDDVAFFNTNNEVSLGADNQIAGLDLRGGISLETKKFLLNVDGDVDVRGGATRLFVGGNNTETALTGLAVHDLNIFSGRVLLGDTILNFSNPSNFGTVGEIDILSGGYLGGNGTLLHAESFDGVTSVLTNDGVLSAEIVNIPGIIAPIGEPAEETLLITALDPDARVDLDGADEDGRVNVRWNQTLEVVPRLSDGFSGEMRLFQDSVLDMPDWTMSGGTMRVNNGFVDSGSPVIPDTPAGNATIRGGMMTHSNGVISVVTSDSTLTFESKYRGVNAAVGVNPVIDNTAGGTVIFKGNDSLLGAGHQLNLAANAQVVVDGATLTVNTPVIDMNGVDANADWTVKNGALLNLHGGSISSSSGGFNRFDGTLRYEGAPASQVSLDVDDGVAQLNRVEVGENTSGFLLGRDNDEVRVLSTIDIGNGGFFQASGLPLHFVGSTGRVTGGGKLIISEMVSLQTDTRFDVNSVGIRNGGNLEIAPGVTWFGEMQEISPFAGRLSLNGGIADVSSPIVVENGGEISLKQAATSSRGSSYRNFEITTFQEGSKLTNSNELGFFQAAAIVEEGAVISNLVADAKLSLAGRGLFEWAGGDFEEVEEGSTLINAGGWTVTGDSDITVSNLDWDGQDDARRTVIQDGGQLDLQVNVFNNIPRQEVSLTHGSLNVETTNGQWTFAGRFFASGGGGSITGDRILLGGDNAAGDDGNIEVDSGVLSFQAPITLRSDAVVEVSENGTLEFNHPGTIFAPVNGSRNGSFSGTGNLKVIDAEIAENTLFSFSGGTVGLGGNLGINPNALNPGDIDINANLTIETAQMEDFGSGLIGVDQSEMNISNLGKLEILLDNPAADWTVRDNGVITYAGASINRVFLDGADVNLGGSLTVGGLGQSNARLEISGAVEISAGGEFTLNGGRLRGGEENRLLGGNMSGEGVLKIGVGRKLTGFGTLDASFSGEELSTLTAKDGELRLNGELLGVGTLETEGENGVLVLGRSLNSNRTSNGIVMNGGRVEGLQLTVAGRSLRGHGRVDARVINNQSVVAQGGTLILGNPLNDWDGVGGGGTLHANQGDLVLEGSNTPMSFQGIIIADSGHRVSTIETFAFNFQNGSLLNLNGGTYSSAREYRIEGELNVDSAGGMLEGAKTVFGGTARTIVNGALSLLTDAEVEAESRFSGTGSVTVGETRSLNLDDEAELGIAITNLGSLLLAGGNVSRANRVEAYNQLATGALEITIQGKQSSEYDLLTVTGAAKLAGELKVQLQGFQPQVGNRFLFLRRTGGSGKFSEISTEGETLPADTEWSVEYRDEGVVLELVSTLAPSDYEEWIEGFPGVAIDERDPLRDPDGDGRNNLEEFALDGDPSMANDTRKYFVSIESLENLGGDYLTMSFPVRDGFGALMNGRINGLNSLIEYQPVTSTTLRSRESELTELTGVNAEMIQTNFPPLNSGWSYRSFRTNASVDEELQLFVALLIEGVPGN